MSSKSTAKKSAPAWGTIIEVDSGEKHKVKKIFVKKGQSIPLHSHSQKIEQWIVVSGHGMLSVDGQERFIGTGGHCSIPKGKRHTIEASVDMELIEVQLGSCDDKDIISADE
jgi:mannose-6-phosphate isomerase-like protein (cupin superfamily)